MKSLGQDAGMLPIEMSDDSAVSVEETLGHVEGLRFVVDPAARHEDRRMLLAAAEKALPRLLAEAEALAASDLGEIELKRGKLSWKGETLAELEQRDGTAMPVLKPAREFRRCPRARAASS